MKTLQFEFTSACITIVVVVFAAMMTFFSLAMPARAFNQSATPTGITGIEKTTSEILTEAAKATPFTGIRTKPAPGKVPTKQPNSNTTPASTGQQGSDGAVPIPPILTFTVLMVLVILVVVVLLVRGKS